MPEAAVRPDRVRSPRARQRPEPQRADRGHRRRHGGGARSGRPRGHGADAGDARARGCRRGRRCPQPARGRRSAAGSGVMSATLVARMDSAGDVLLAGPAIRAVAAGAGPVAALCGHRGRAAAELLPGVSEVIEWTAPWIDPDPEPVDAVGPLSLVSLLRNRFARAIVLTSFHQSPLPLALLLRMAGVEHVAAISEDYPGSLLDLRHRPDDRHHEVERSPDLVAQLGYRLPPDDGGELRIKRES